MAQWNCDRDAPTGPCGSAPSENGHTRRWLIQAADDKGNQILVIYNDQNKAVLMSQHPARNIDVWSEDIDGVPGPELIVRYSSIDGAPAGKTTRIEVFALNDKTGADELVLSHAMGTGYVLFTGEGSAQRMTIVAVNGTKVTGSSVVSRGADGAWSVGNPPAAKSTTTRPPGTAVPVTAG